MLVNVMGVEILAYKLNTGLIVLLAADGLCGGLGEDVVGFLEEVEG